MNRYAKAIVAAVTAGAGAFTSAQEAGASAGHALIAALVMAVLTGAVTWGVPNQVVQAIEGLYPTKVNVTSDAPTAVFPKVTS